MEELTKSEKGNRQKGIIFSVVFHTLVIILAALYGFTFQNPPPEAMGVLVNLGIPDVGQGDENAPASAPAEAVEETEPEVEPEQPVEEEEEVKPEPVKEKPKTEPKKEVVKTEDPEAAALKKKKEEEKKRAEAEAKEKARAEAEAKAKAEAKARQQAEADRKAKELKDQIGGALGGNGKGKGKTGQPGNQGDPNGGDSDILEGKSTGTDIKGDLGGRGVAFRPGAFSHNCPETGRVVVRVCADASGSVTVAEYQLSGSDVIASCNKEKAIAHARKYKFNKGSGTVCGTITYKFDQK